MDSELARLMLARTPCDEALATIQLLVRATSLLSEKSFPESYRAAKEALNTLIREYGERCRGHRRQ